MTTIKLAILKHTRAKDGSYKIRISIGHKSETSYIVTKYRVTAFSNFKNGVVVGQPDASSINLKLRRLLTKFDERLERIPNPSDYSCTQLRNLLENMSDVADATTLATVTQEYCDHLRQDKRDTYATLIEWHMKRFFEFTHGDIFMTELSPRLIDDYSRQVRASGASPAYESMRLVPIRTIVNYAIKMQLVKYDVHPFLYWKAQKAEPREIDISVEELRVLSAHQSKYRGIRRAIDFLMLSYYLGGINLIDLLAYDFRDYQSKPLSYVRKKTRNKKQSHSIVTFTIPSEAYPLIEKYMDKKTGKLQTHYKGSYISLLTVTNRSLKSVAKQLSLSCAQYISYYSARKSFVQHGFDIGIPLEVLEYCIGQSMKANRPIFNYYKVMQKHADAAIRKILDNLKTSPSVADEEAKDL